MNAPILILAGSLALPLAFARGPEPAPTDPNGALQRLVAGNHRYVTHGRHPRQDRGQRVTLAKAQHPFACVLSCSDSRVPPEIVFDQGLGDLFVVRVAGNIVDDPLIGSIEYATEHLHVPLVVVLGHTRCGAVTAAVQGAKEDNHIMSLVKAIVPAVEHAKTEQGDLLNNSIRENVLQTVKQLRESHPLLSELYEHHKIQIIGAIYDLDSGRVQFALDPAGH